MKRQKVLYVEADAANRKLLQLTLERTGVECEVAEDGRSALRMFESYKYDAVILDQHVVESAGEDIARIIRKSHPNIPMIAVTTDDSVRNVLFGSGYNEVFVKPFCGNDVVNAVKSTTAL